MNEKDLEKLSKAELIKIVEKLQKKAKKPKIVIVDDDNSQLPQPITQPQKTPKYIPPRDSLKSIQIDQNHQSNPPYQD